MKRSGRCVRFARRSAVHGSRSRSNSFTWDGADGNDQDVGTRRQGFLVPSPVEVLVEGLEFIVEGVLDERSREVNLELLRAKVNVAAAEFQEAAAASRERNEESNAKVADGADRPGQTGLFYVTFPFCFEGTRRDAFADNSRQPPSPYEVSEGRRGCRTAEISNTPIRR